ncbi:hypothetical protein F5I97DRAFT_1809116, partial [Phlebopus sp. FC_14]
GQLQFRTLKAALRHEQTSREHARHVSERNWWRQCDESGWDASEYPSLTSEGLQQWEMHTHVDHVFDLVPFWQRAVDAAERGQVLRLEEFLEKMEGGGGWRTANEVLGMLGEGRLAASADGEDGLSVEAASDGTKSSSGGWKKGWAVEHGRQVRPRSEHVHWDEEVVASGEDVQRFVESVARQTAVNEERRQQMHRFFEMSTEEKIQKIQETIHFLRNHR